MALETKSYMRVKTDGRYYFVLNETIKEKQILIWPRKSKKVLITII